MVGGAADRHVRPMVGGGIVPRSCASGVLC